MNRTCPNCSRESISVSGLIVSVVACPACGEHIGVHWAYRAIFFVVIFAVAVLTTIVVYVDQGLYAAMLMVSVPIGVIGYIKARYCPLVIRRRHDEQSRTRRL